MLSFAKFYGKFDKSVRIQKLRMLVLKEPFNYAHLFKQYTIINFLPKNLFEQFRRIITLYYLINVIIMVRK